MAQKDETDESERRENIMRINVNNGRFLEIERRRPSNYGITVASCDSNGYVERRDGFDEGEIVMAINLMRYMRDNGMKSVYLMDDLTRDHLRNLIDSGCLEEFTIFQ